MLTHITQAGLTSYHCGNMGLAQYGKSAASVPGNEKGATEFLASP